MTVIDTPITRPDPSQVRQLVVDNEGIAFADTDTAIAWLAEETNFSFMAGSRPLIVEQLINQLQSEKRRSEGLKRLNALYLAQLVWVVLGKLFAPLGLRKKVAGDLRSSNDEVRQAAMVTAIELLSKAEEEYPRKVTAIETIKELADDAYLTANSTMFDWQEEIISKCQADRAMTCPIGGLEGTAKHLRNCETRLYGTGSEPQGGARKGKGMDPRKAEKAARDRSIRASMKGKQGQKPQPGSKK